MTDPYLPTIGYTFGGTKVAISSRDIKPKLTNDLAEAIAQLRFKLTSMKDNPIRDGETLESWSIRAANESPNSQKRADESIDKYIDRIFLPKLETVRRGYDILEILSVHVKSALPSAEEYASTKWLAARVFLHDCLSQFELVDEAGHFMPKGMISDFFEADPDDKESVLPVLTYRFGKTPVRFATRKFDLNLGEKLAVAIRNTHPEVKLLKEFTIQDGETLRMWQNRLRMAQSKKEMGESIDKYISRVFKPNLDIMNRGYNCIKALCEIFDQPVPSQEEFDSAVWPEVRCFLYDCLNLFELVEEADHFLPKGLLSGFIVEEETSRVSKEAVGREVSTSGKSKKK